MIPCARPWAVIALFVFMAEGAWAQDQQADRGSQSSPVAQLDYTIGAGDVLQVLVWREENFSGSFTVRFDGRITLLLVGDVMAADRTPEELSRHLERELSRYIESPRVTVAVSEANSARFYVIGRVAEQGAFPYTGPIRVVQALALAGGVQEFAKLDRVFIMREVRGKLIYYPVNYDQLVDNRNLAGNIPILPGDTIVVP